MSEANGDGPKGRRSDERSARWSLRARRFAPLPLRLPVYPPPHRDPAVSRELVATTAAPSRAVGARAARARASGRRGSAMHVVAAALAVLAALVLWSSGRSGDEGASSPASPERPLRDQELDPSTGADASAPALAAPTASPAERPPEGSSSSCGAAVDAAAH